jgi:hypothetical protein
VPGRPHTWLRWIRIVSLLVLSGREGWTQSVSAPAAGKYAANTSNQSASGFVVSWPNTTDILYGTIYIDNPPSGTTLNFSSTPSGLTAATGYTLSTGSFTTMAFTGNVTNFNAALNTLRVSTGGTNGNFTIVVTATANPANTYYNPRNGHWYRYVLGKPTISGDAGFNQLKSTAASTTFKGKNGYLVSLTDSSEHSFVQNNVPGKDILIGLTDFGSEGNWRWDQGPDSGTVIRTANGGTILQQAGQSAGSPNVAGKYNNWCSGEPNDWGPGEDYAVTKWNNGSCWNDYGPAATYDWGSIEGYVIEFGTSASAADQNWSEFYRASVAHYSSTATNLGVTTSAAGAASGVAFTTQPVIQLRDASNGAVSQSGVVVTITVSAGPTLLGTTTATTNASGVATFSGLSLTGTAGTYTLTYSATGLTSATQSITLTAGAASQVVLTRQPVGGASGGALATQPLVAIRDAQGNTVTSSTAAVTVAIGSGAGGTLGGTTTVNAVSGVATFSNVTLAAMVGTNYTLSFTSGALSSATSSTVTVTAGSANKLAFSTQPVGGPSGQYLATQPVVVIQDAQGNTVTSSTANVTLSFGTNAGGTGVLGGSVTVAAVAGVATFTSVAVHKAAAGYTLVAASSSLSSATSSAFTVSTPLTLPSADVIDYKSRSAGAAPTTKTGAAYAAEVASLIAVAPTTGFCDKALTSSGLTQNATQCPSGVNGEFMIRLRTIFTPTPQLIGARLWVRVRGDFGRGAVLQVDGTEKLFRESIEDDWNAWQLSSATTLSSGSKSIEWMGFERCCDGGVAMEWSTDSLEWAVAQSTVTVTQVTLDAPSDLTSGGARATYTVSRRDAGGNLASPASAQTVYLTATGGTFYSALSGGTTVTSVVIASGQSQATVFFGATVAGSYTVTASDASPANGATGLVDATDGIVVNAGAAATLALTTNAAGAASGAAFTTQPVVAIRDAAGNTVTSDNSTVVTLTVSAGGTVVGTATVNAVTGVATFTNAGLSGTAGTAYTLTYAATGLTSATQSVTPTAGAASQLVLTTQPVAGVSGTVLTTQPVVAIRDAQGNTVTTSSAPVKVVIATGAGGTLGGTTTVNAVDGVSTFSDLTLAGTVGTTYTLAFTSGALTAATSGTITLVGELPSAPTAVTVQALDKAVEVTWTRPIREGTAPIAEYVIEYSTDGVNWATVSPPADHSQTRIRISNLINNMVYRLRVAARSAIGRGPFATADSTAVPTAPVVPAGASTPPTLSPGVASVIVNGSAQASTVRVVEDSVVQVANNDFSMTMVALDDARRARTVDTGTGTLRLEQGAQVQVAGRGFLPGTVVTVWLFSEPRRLGQILVRGDGTYEDRMPVPIDIQLGEHTLQANGVDQSQAERSVSLGVRLDEPADIVANAPSDVDAAPLDGGAQLTWVPPVYAGGDPVRSYVVQLSRDGGTTWTDTLSVAAGDPSPVAQVTGLTNGTSYRFRVIAVNATGRSAPSAASPVVTPFKPTPLLRIAIVTSTATPAMGDTVTFRVTVRNEGTGAARNTVVPLPDEPRFTRISGTATQGAVDLVAGRWSVGTVAINGEAVLTLRVVVRKGSDPQGVR